jgi:hypothetical protein
MNKIIFKTYSGSDQNLDSIYGAKALPPITMYTKRKKNKKDGFLDSIITNLKDSSKHLNLNNILKTEPNSPSRPRRNDFNSTFENNSNFNNTNEGLVIPTMGNLTNNSIDDEIHREIENLKKYYFDTNKKEKVDKSQKKEIFKKYHIKDKLSNDEISHISSMLKTREIHHDWAVFNNTNSGLVQKSIPTHNSVSIVGKTVITTENPEYKDPLKSMKKLKANKQIFDNVVNLITTKQIEMYRDKFNETINFNSKLSKMPEFRVTSNILSTRIKEKMMENEQNTMTVTHTDPDVSDNMIVENNYKQKKGKSYKILSRDDMLLNHDYHGSFGPFSKFRPSARSQSTLTADRDGNLILIGGVNTDRLIDFWKCDSSTLTWRSLRVYGEFPLPRMGHSAVQYKNNIYIYGGNIEQDAKMPKEDLTVFHVDQNRVSIERCYNKSNVKWRRNHIAGQIGYCMLVHGGIDDTGEFLADSYTLDLESFRWNELIAKEDHFKPSPVAYHSACVVLTSEKRMLNNFSIYKFPDLSKSPMNSIKYEGVYVFGGIDKEGICNNQLRLLKCGKKPLEWLKINAEGTPPCPRYSASMSFHEDLEVLIVHGGRDDKSKEFVFMDTYLFDLYHFTWTKLNVFENTPKRRSEHSAVISQNKLIIFGGMSIETFIGSELYLIELDYFDNKKCKADYDSQKIFRKKHNMENKLHTILSEMGQNNEGGEQSSLQFITENKNVSKPKNEKFEFMSKPTLDIIDSTYKKYLKSGGGLVQFNFS